MEKLTLQKAKDIIAKELAERMSGLEILQNHDLLPSGKAMVNKDYDTEYDTKTFVLSNNKVELGFYETESGGWKADGEILFLEGHDFEAPIEMALELLLEVLGEDFIELLESKASQEG